MRGFNTLRRETTLDGPGDLGGGPQPLLDLDNPPPAAADPAAPAEPDYGAQIEELQATIAQQQAMLQQIANSPFAQMMQPQPPQGPQGPIPPNPWESENFQQDLAGYVQDTVQQATQPYQEMLADQHIESLRGSARDIISDIEAQKGELLRPSYEQGQEGLDPIEDVIDLALEYYPQIAQRIGETGRAEEQAFDMAYEEVKRYQSAIVNAQNQIDTNHMNTLRQAPREPGSSGISSMPESTTVNGGLAAFKERWGLT